MQTKSLESKLRNQAAKQGLSIKKSRSALNVDNQGGYMIIDINNVIIAGEKFNLFLEDIEKYLNS